MSPDEIRAFRARLGWSQDALAEALSVDGRLHPLTVSRWERGTSRPPPFLRLALRALEQEPARP